MIVISVPVPVPPFEFGLFHSHMPLAAKSTHGAFRTLMKHSWESRYLHCILLDPKIPILEAMSLTSNHLHDALTTNDIPTLRNLLETQDTQLLSQVAQTGMPETAAYILSRFPNSEDYSQHLPHPSATLNPIQYLLTESARCGNASIFRYVLSKHPKFLSTHNRNVESILVNAMDGGVEIWKVILEHDAGWKDHEFSRHRGCVLEVVIELEKKPLLEFLLQHGADTDRAGDPIMESAEARRASPEMIELIKKYSR